MRLIQEIGPPDWEAIRNARLVEVCGYFGARYFCAKHAIRELRKGIAVALANVGQAESGVKVQEVNNAKGSR